MTCTGENSLIILINSWEILKNVSVQYYFYIKQSIISSSQFAVWCALYFHCSLILSPTILQGDVSIRNHKILIKNLLYWGHIYKCTYTMSCIFSRYTYIFKKLFLILSYVRRKRKSCMVRINIKIVRVYTFYVYSKLFWFWNFNFIVQHCASFRGSKFLFSRNVRAIYTLKRA